MNDAPDDPAPRPRRQGGRGVLLALTVVAILGVAIYLAWTARLHRPPLPPAPAPASQVVQIDPQLEALRQRVAALEQQVAALAAAPKLAPTGPAGPLADAAANSLSARLAELSSRVQGDEARIDAAAVRAARTARLQQAALALANGQKLGDIPDAPTALARFRTEPPPTEAQLRKTFPAAARLAARPDTATLGVWRAMRARLGAMVTIRNGDHVILGSPQTRILDTAKAALDAGDLAGAVATLDTLDPPAALAMAPWREQAKALLAARAALAGG